MKTLITRNGTYLARDEIVNAVINYDFALCQHQAVDRVDVPFVSSDGSHHSASLTIGWQTGTTALSDPLLLDNLSETELIESLYAKSKSVGAIHGRPFSDAEEEHFALTFSDQVDYL